MIPKPTPQSRLARPFNSQEGVQFKPLRVAAKFGKSTHPKAFRYHLVHPDRCKVKYFPGRPELTEYRFLWMCGKSSATGIEFCDKLPAGEVVCRGCRVMEEVLDYWSDKGGWAGRSSYMMRWSLSTDWAARERWEAERRLKRHEAAQPF